ncbi:MAG TPA: amidohydrolase family protein [Candidatus Koribacter sp.]|jgi:imidazolonepropionase-like amidohydrolase
MQTRWVRVVALLFLFLPTLLAAQTVAIRAGHLIDPASGKVSQNQVILVRDKKIVEVGDHVSIPAGTAVLDLSNSWVMPGIMDAHTHITEGGEEKWRELTANYLREGTGFRSLRGLHTAQILLNAGITTVRDIGNEANYAAVDLKRAINEGWFIGPTILSAGKIIAPYGGQNGGIPAEQGEFWKFEYLQADSPDEVRAAVRKNIYYGVDVIKLVADEFPYYYSVDEIKAAVQEAHAAGYKVAVHVLRPEAAANVIEGGADSIEHGFFLTDDELRRMKEKGMFLVGTDFPAEHFIRGGLPNGKEWGEKIIDRLHRAYVIGVKMGFGSDIVMDFPGTTRATMTWDYLAVWKAAGVPPVEVLKCMTTNNAELLGISKERGAIATGQYADIIAMPRNPFDDTEALRGINFVMKNGTVVVQPK